MQAIRVHRFGDIDALVAEEVPRPIPGEGQVLLRVKAAGVGPWDAWIRSGRSVLPQPLPLTLGSDVAGIVEAVGPGESPFAAGDAVFGATNAQFTGGYAVYAVASAATLARMPRRLGFVEAASVPVVACTAWQMVFEYGAVDRSKRVLVHGAAGNVGAYAVQMARGTAREVIATVGSGDVEDARALGADRVVDVRASRFEDVVAGVDVVVDTIGGDVQERSFTVLTPGGVLISAVSVPNQRRRRSGACGPSSSWWRSRPPASTASRRSSTPGNSSLVSATCCRCRMPASRTRCSPGGRTSGARSSWRWTDRADVRDASRAGSDRYSRPGASAGSPGGSPPRRTRLMPARSSWSAAGATGRKPRRER